MNWRKKIDNKEDILKIPYKFAYWKKNFEQAVVEVEVFLSNVFARWVQMP